MNRKKRKVSFMNKTAVNHLVYFFGGTCFCSSVPLFFLGVEFLGYKVGVCLLL